MSTSTLTIQFKKRLGTKHTLARGRIHFQDGQWIHVFMGPSGAGKTTLARWMAGLTEADEGSLDWNGKALVHLSPQQRRVGFMPQGDRLFPHLTVIQNVAYGLRNWEKSKREARLAQTLKSMGLGGLEHRRPATLSGGEKRRVALAQVLAFDPVLLILDEPFAGLDHDFRKSLWAELKSWIEASQLPTLVITHDPLEARALSGNIHLYKNDLLVLE